MLNYIQSLRLIMFKSLHCYIKEFTLNYVQSVHWIMFKIYT